MNESIGNAENALLTQEIAALTAVNDKFAALAKRTLARAELAESRLKMAREAIENAPHDDRCDATNRSWSRCKCWKAAALAAIDAPAQKGTDK